MQSLCRALDKLYRTETGVAHTKELKEAVRGWTGFEIIQVFPAGQLFASEAQQYAVSALQASQPQLRRLGCKQLAKSLVSSFDSSKCIQGHGQRALDASRHNFMLCHSTPTFMSQDPSYIYIHTYGVHACVYAPHIYTWHTRGRSSLHAMPQTEVSCHLSELASVDYRRHTDLSSSDAPCQAGCCMCKPCWDCLLTPIQVWQLRPLKLYSAMPARQMVRRNCRRTLRHAAHSGVQIDMARIPTYAYSRHISCMAHVQLLPHRACISTCSLCMTASRGHISLSKSDK